MDFSPKKIFISYAKEDRDSASRLYKDLIQVPYFKVWFDEFNLLPGHNWKSEISKGIRESDYFIAILSHHSITKRGFVQRELKEALDVMLELPHDRIYLIPVRLDDSKPKDPALLEKHWVDFFPIWENGFYKLYNTIIFKFEENFGFGMAESLVEISKIARNAVELYADSSQKKGVQLNFFDFGANIKFL